MTEGYVRVLFRADATAEIGAGHLMRCFGLAQHLKDRGVGVHLATVAPKGPFVDRWREEGIEVHALTAPRATAADARTTADLARGQPIVIDGYDFGFEFVSALGRSPARIALFDDLNDRPLKADIVINQNPGAETNFSYDLPSNALLLGCRYAILRRAVRESSHEGGGGVLVTLGGGDQLNLGLVVVRLLAAAKIGMPVHLICTAGEKGLRNAQEFCAENPGFSVSPGGEIVEFFRRADVALCAGGTTPLELAYLGVPMSIVTLAENQKPGAAAIAKAGAALVAGTVEGAVKNLLMIVSDKTMRRGMSQASRALVDGNGVERVATALLAA